MTNYPKGSLGEQEQKNTKTFYIIAVIGFVVLHAADIFLSHNLFGNMKTNGWLWIFPALAVITLAACIYGRVKEKDWAEESNWPYIVLMLLSMASAVSIGWCQTC